MPKLTISRQNLSPPTPDSLGALTVVELNSPRVAPLPTPDSRFPTPDSRFPTPEIKKYQ
ncbi:MULTISPECIES: hypothetical protein [Moorena]|uniref:hypothetical protein n=1 Tax=Moorena TaxID=1155738 RepID=UPI00030A1F54|nr:MULTISPECIES: hypothetical protein [Moorena]NEQ16470.1 hypothetical protein [Moorena sp. SIO3E2]NEP30963.1 hypothetical protein [Moorena sp. SIO3B2]NEP68596.1 hypothetical protein [Moorena sp. SIO3A5]NER91316.1 hypothetical protein [Moorena sp. SIO3A2]NET68748.1 hypothetical protein [Moorena sp. SIO1G6]